MIRPPFAGLAAANEFLMCSGLLQKHVAEGVPLERVARDYGYSVDRLRAKLQAHLATCLEAVTGSPDPMPEVTPVTPPADLPAAPPIRIRERVPRNP